MIYKILLDGKEVDRCQWPGIWHLQAVQLEEYCEDHDYELVKTRPNSTFTEVSVTVKRA